jgi:ArsR family transcriptional regulator
MPGDARALWQLLAACLDEPVLAADRERCEALVRARTQEEPWPDSVAGAMERVYSPGRTWESTARGLLGLVHLGDVLDAGSGDGAMAELLAPRARSVTLLDRSDKVLEAARRKLEGRGPFRFAPGDFHELPFADATFDQVLLFHGLVYAHDPERVVAEGARVLRPGGDLAITTLAAHGQREITDGYGHLHAGFEPARLRGWLEGAGLSVDLCEITSREKREPHFLVISAFARKPKART